MNKAKRLQFQIVIWAVIWLVLSIAQNLELLFILENIPVYIFQICSITFLIYYAAPIFFLEKKYVRFTAISLAIIVVLAIIIAFLHGFSQERPPHRPPEPRHERDRSPKVKQGPLTKIKERRSETQQRIRPSILIHLTHGLFLIIAYLMGLFIEGIHFLQKKEQETILIKNEALHSELKLLKLQINPHFLFNTLNNIYALAAFDANKTQQSIRYLSDMLRYVLYECERPLVSVKKEVKYIEDYIELFSLKNSKKYPIVINTQIMEPSVNIAPMVLIPFVENAIKHSHIEKLRATFIHIFLKVDKDAIQFRIENSKSKEIFNKDEVGGIGLENVKRRLAILYPNCHELTIKQTNETFKVELILKPKNDA